MRTDPPALIEIDPLREKFMRINSEEIFPQKESPHFSSQRAKMGVWKNTSVV
jgi:hypothetical protein